MKKSYLLIFAILVLFGCKSLETKLPAFTPILPSNYTFTDENKAFNRPEWRKYFGDTILVALIEKAVVNNMELQMARQFILMNRSEVIESTGALLPTAMMGTSAAMRRFGLYTMDGAGNASTDILPGKVVPTNLPDLYIGPIVSWEVDVWGKLKNDKKADIARYAASMEGVRFFTTQLVSEIATYYATLLALDRELTIIQQMIGMQQQALEIIIAQKEAGKANELAIQQFNAQILDTKALEQEIQQQIVEVENNLNFLTSQFGYSVPRASMNDFRLDIEQLDIGNPSALLSARPDVREAELGIEGANFDLLATKRAFLPRLNIVGNFGVQAFSGAYLFTTPASLAYTALASLTAPLFNLSALKAQFTNANARQLHAIYHYHSIVLNAYREIVTEYTNTKNLERINAIKIEQAQILVQSVETSTELYKTGRATYLEVLLAQQNALSAQLETVNVQLRQSIAYINLYRAMGGGWE